MRPSPPNMLTEVTIENFRALRRVDVEVAPLTVLIGENNTGKSSFMDAIMQAWSVGSMTARDCWRRASETQVRIELSAAGKGRFARTWHFQHQADAASQSTPVGEVDAISPWRFRLTPERIASTAHATVEDKHRSCPRMGADGHGIPVVADWMLRHDRKRFDRFVEELRRHIVGLEQVNVPTPDPQTRALDLILEGGFRLPFDQASTGVKYLVFFVALAMHPTPPPLVMIEEPENGVHPRRLAEIVALLKKLSDPVEKLGSSVAQVIIETHSPFVLDCIDLDRDQVIVFRRGAEGECRAEAVDRKRLATFLPEFTLGEVWFNSGEETLVPKE